MEVEIKTGIKKFNWQKENSVPQDLGAAKWIFFFFLIAGVGQKGKLLGSGTNV